MSSERAAGTTTHEKHYKSAWHPLGFWRTIRFFSPWHPQRCRVAAWRHFGWELEVEIAPGERGAYLRRHA